MEYYTIDKILEIIKYYHINMNNLKSMVRGMRSVGVTQYGIESSLPKGNTISNVVEKEALRQIENTRYYSEILTDIKYLQDRWDRVTDEKEAQVLSLRLDGLTITDISRMLELNRSTVYRILIRVAKRIKGYPQAVDTDTSKIDL